MTFTHVYNKIQKQRSSENTQSRGVS